MLELNNIVKDYISGDTRVTALKGINLRFRDSEFVSILGQSGCGKTTMFNALTGANQYVGNWPGDLIINGISTKKYKDRDWDSYRNHTIGFVFQSYNLIPHQTVLANVELALTLSGVSKSERRKRAIEALEKVGLKEQIHKKPNQMSGGQMQRVAIARALVNDPDILLADEPTGALDTETSVQIMEILKEIAKDRLIIMVTHNPELAEQYSTRIIRLLDGQITDDTDAYSEEQMEADIQEKEQKLSDAQTGKKKKKAKTSMSFFTALSLSMNNLMTKKTRTLLTAFAGSIGIIGIALILSISNGIQDYIDRVQRDTLSSYPVQLQSQTMDISSMIEMMTGSDKDSVDHDKDKVYSNMIMSEMMNTMISDVKNNNLKSFKKYIDDNKDEISTYASDIRYSYNIDINIYDTDTSDGVTQLNPSTIMNTIYGTNTSQGSMSAMYTNADVWNQLPGNQDLLDSQYDMVAGRWPQQYNEVVLVVDENNEIDDYTLYSLGFKDPDEVTAMYKRMMTGETYDTEETEYTYDEILDKKFQMILPTDYYRYNAEKDIWEDMREDETYMKNVVDNGTQIQVCGIIRQKEDAVNTAIRSGVGYTKELMQYLMQGVNDSEVAKAQLADETTDIFTGIPFDHDKDTPITMDDVNAYVATLSEQEQAQMQAYMSQMTEEQILQQFSQSLKAQTTEATFEGNKEKLGITNEDNPSEIDLYAASFEAKEKLEDIISDYNKKATDEGRDEDVINYTDYVGIMMSSVSTIITAISAVLIAFVAISLVVSSIMIGIITYISVLERTKEIGILRSIGASKKDVSRVFNAETLIEGFVSGALGIVITLILCIPANRIIENVTTIAGVAKLPVAGAVILVIISMVLTLIAGFVPAKMAAKKDPVVALRTE